MYSDLTFKIWQEEKKKHESKSYNLKTFFLYKMSSYIQYSIYWCERFQGWARAVTMALCSGSTWASPERHTAEHRVLGSTPHPRTFSPCCLEISLSASQSNLFPTKRSSASSEAYCGISETSHTDRQMQTHTSCHQFLIVPSPPLSLSISRGGQGSQCFGKYLLRGTNNYHGHGLGLSHSLDSVKETTKNNRQSYVLRNGPQL